MSKRQLKAQASSTRAATSAFASGFGLSNTSAFGTHVSQLSHVAEPPDLSRISDSHVVVYFRNLSKRDSTTKAKALEELQAYISSLETPVEDGVLEAWISIYPRTSIDNSKAVRQNAHSLHGSIAASAGKRIAQFMPKCVAAWLCGLYDTDRSVVEATQNSLRLVFKANEKIQNIRPLYQRQILEYCTAAVQNETPTTLSDERTVSKDDAATKYSRLVSTCTALVGSLLSNLKEQDIAKYKDSYSELLGDKKIWELGLHEDPSIRRSVHRLLRICLESSPQFIEGILSIVSKVYLANGLNSDQTGSSYDYIQALSLLTSKYPTVWTEHYTSKTSVDRRLRQFLKMGSQMGPSSFWPSLVDLFKALPSAAKPHNGADAAELLGALHGGVSRKEEPRPNLEAAFGAYLDITEHLCQSLPPDDSEKVLKELILPIITQYLQPKQENSEWTVPSNSAKVVAKAISIPGMASVVRDVWPQYSQKVIDNIKTSAPEQSQNYKESQNSLVSQASKLATVQDIASSSESEGGLQSIFSDTCESVITAAVNVLKSRNGKPYGAAGVIKEILSHNSSLVFSNKAMEEKVATFVRDDIPSLMLSPSGPQLLDIVIALPDTSAFNPAWDASLNAVLAAEDSPTKATTLRSILTSPKIPKSVDLTRPELQEYIKSVGKSALDGSSEWKSFSDILLSSSHIMSPTTTDEILSAMTDSLTLAEKATRALQGFQEIVQSAPEMLKTYASSETGSGLLHSLVLASESPDDDVALKAAEVNASIQSLVGSGSDSRQAIFNVIQQNLRHASSESLSVETLFNMAKTLTESLQVDENASIDLEQVGGLFPRLHDWEAILSPYLDIPPVPGYHGLPLTVATSLVKPGTNTPVKPRSRDRDGYSPVFRILQYMAKLFGPREGLFRVDKLPQPENWQYVRNFIITSTLIAEDLSFPGTYSLWEPWSPNLNQFSQDMGLAYAANLIISLKPIQIDESPLWRWAFEVLSNTETDRSPRSFHMVDAAAFLVRKWSNRPGVREQLQVGILEDQLKILFRSDTLPKLLILNALLFHPLNTEHGVQPISKQRVIFCVRRVRPWLQDSTISTPVREAVCRLLRILLPMMSDIYGDHWGEILGALTKSWKNIHDFVEDNRQIHSPITYVTDSLALYQCLKDMTVSGDPNDDLVDALKAMQGRLSDGLVNLLKHANNLVPQQVVPLELQFSFSEAVRRLQPLIVDIPCKYVQSPEELYALLYVDSYLVQEAAFGILHEKIPAEQEQVSIDAALDKKAARMAEELLSMILDVPTNVDLEKDYEQYSLSLRGYLWSWLLVFDHFDNASFKVKNDYAEQLKEGNYLSALLDFAFSFLGHARGKPVKFSTKGFITDWSQFEYTDARFAHHLLAHVYTLSLTHLPSLTKSWFIECKSRPVAVSLEAWTEKYISPFVITSALDAVTEWATSQAEQDPDSPFRVTVNPRAREIYAYYTFDEQTMSMRISLPPAYPLVSASIEGLTRFVVTEQKWQSWLHASRGAITIFNGSLVDALTTFRRNVDGAIKGHTECAICYSIVGPDKKVPDKRCATCKNLFHGGCLFKWFKSSGSSTCPLCRMQISYG